LTEDFFAVAPTIHVSCVEEIHAEIRGSPYGSD